ncbi:MAG: MprA protease, GlyGly-CTERM protein-sorting domain-containing form [Algisphaera sp.]
MPGMTSGLGMMGNGMVHSEVAVQNHVVSVALRDGPSGPANPATRLVAGVAGLFASPFDVLNGQAYNAQYGWLEDQTIGFTPIDIASDEFIWIEQTNVTGPGIVAVYEGGNGMQMPNHTMDPILNTPGSLSSAWMWDEGFKMQHNWYAFSAPGDYDVDYRVYVGDASGAAISGYTDGAVTFQFTAVPEPASSTLLLTTGLLGLCRRRRA